MSHSNSTGQLVAAVTACVAGLSQGAIWQAPEQFQKTFPAEDGQRYFELASEPKQIAWYDNCGHEFNTQARLDRATWLCETLHLTQPSQEIVQLLEQVPSPTPLEG
jgi:hypothetical protein